MPQEIAYRMGPQSAVRRASAPASFGGSVQALAAANGLIHQRDVVCDRGIAGVLGLRLGEFRARFAQVAAQKIRIADVVDDFRPRPEDRERLAVGTVGEIIALQAIVGGGKPEPGLAIARCLLDRTAEMLLGEAVVLLAIMPFAEDEVVVAIAAKQLIVHSRRTDRNNGRCAACDFGRGGSGAARHLARSGRWGWRVLSPVEASELEFPRGSAAGERRHQGERGEDANDTHGLTPLRLNAPALRNTQWLGIQRTRLPPAGA